jgi:hypothetical protein
MSVRSIHEFGDKQGSTRHVKHAPGALESWEKVAVKLGPRKAALVEGQLIAVFEDWINGCRFHTGWAEPEGNLADGASFFAIKRIPVRAYFWYSKRSKNTIVVSHYVNKTWRKLRLEDTNRVKANCERERAGGVNKW